MVTDPIADYLTRVRNAIMAGHKIVEIPSSNLKTEMTRILHEQGYILNYKVEEDKGPQGSIKIALKYDRVTEAAAIRKLERVSKPGLRTLLRLLIEFKERIINVTSRISAN